MRKPTFEEISSFIEYRANHVALVQKLGKVALDLDFSDHDSDKIESTGKDLDLLTLRHLSKTKDLKLSPEDKNELRKVSARHAKSQKHHAEYWDPSVSVRNFNEEDKNVVHASNMPKRYLAEMACDWASCALYHNEPIFKWFNKVINEYLFLTDNQVQYLKDCLNKILKAIGSKDIRFPGVKYTANQVAPKNTDFKKVKESKEDLKGDFPENSPREEYNTKTIKKEDALEALNNSILNQDKYKISLVNGDLHEPSINKKLPNNKKFTGIVKPSEVDNNGREYYMNQILDNKEEIINLSSKDKSTPSVIDIIEVDGDFIRREDNFKFASGTSVSDHTPTLLISFADPSFRDSTNPEETPKFKIALGFKDTGNKKVSSIQTKEIEGLLAEIVCYTLNYGKEIPKEFFERDLKNTNKRTLNSWKSTIEKTSEVLLDYFKRDLGSNEKYIVCRENDIFIPSESKKEITKSKNYEGKKSIHSLINEVVKDPRTSGIFLSNKKDSWNPSDIYIVKKKSYITFCEEWESLINRFEDTRKNLGEESNKSPKVFNDFLKSKIIEYGEDGKNLLNEVVGVSLKKIKMGSNPVLEEVNLNQGEYVPLKVLGEPDSLKIPSIDVIEENKKDKTISGILFKCPVSVLSSDLKDLSPSNEKITFSYRNFDGMKSNTLYMETQSSESEARTGKSPNALLKSLEKESHGDLSENFNINNKNITKVLLSDRMIQYIAFISGEGINKNPLNIKDPNGISLSTYSWEKYVLSISSSKLMEKRDPDSIKKIKRINQWPQVIDLLYALSYSKYKDNLSETLTTIYDWCSKRGSKFAPYILIH